MRKINVSILLLLFTVNAFSQQLDTKAPRTADAYEAKSNKQKKTGRILLVVGATLIVASFVIPRGELTHDGICIGPYCTDEYKNDGLKSVVLAGGALSALGSLPFFISSLKNRRRAASISIKAERFKSLYSGYVSSVGFPVLAVKLKF
jgi:hypothetical protein